MKVILTVKTKDEIKDGKRIVEYNDKEFELDLSLNCQMRWERYFPEQAKNEDLILYTERIREIGKKEKVSASLVISMLKTVYCYFDTDISFQQFLKLFDFSSIEQTEKFVNDIKNIFEIVLAEATEKN